MPRSKEELFNKSINPPVSEQPTLQVPKARVFLNIEGKSSGAVSSFGYGFKDFSKTRKLSSVTLPFYRSLSNTSLADNKFVQAVHMQLLLLCACCLWEDVGFCNLCQEICV